MRGVPFNVTVFATNGRGNGESVSEVVYVEEDGMCKAIISGAIGLYRYSLPIHSSRSSKRCGS